MADRLRGSPAERMRSTFALDLRASFLILRRSPLLVVTTMVVWTVPRIISTPTHPPVWLTFLSYPALVFVLFGLGLSGTARLWFFRASENQPLPGLREVWSLSWRYLGRFLRLWLLILVVALPVTIWTFNVPAALWAGYVLAFLLDFVLTFVNPTLALDTKRVRTAVRTGVGMIAGTWPASALYILVPGLTVVVATNVLARRVLGATAAIPAQVLAVLLDLWFDGAVTLFYLRHRRSIGLPSPATL